MAKFITATMNRYDFFSDIRKIVVAIRHRIFKKKRQSNRIAERNKMYDALLSENRHLNNILDYLSYSEWFDPFTYLLICEEVKMIPTTNVRSEDGNTLQEVADGSFYYYDGDETCTCTCLAMHEEYIILREHNALRRDLVEDGYDGCAYYRCMHNTWKHLENIRVLTEHQLARNEVAMENLLGEIRAAA